MQKSTREGAFLRVVHRAVGVIVQQVVSIPVVLTGGITDVKTADDLLRDGAADLIGVGRSIFKDPGWAKGIP